MYPVNLTKGQVLKVGLKVIEGKFYQSEIIDLDGQIWLQSEYVNSYGYKLGQSKCISVAQAEDFMFSDGYR